MSHTATVTLTLEEEKRLWIKVVEYIRGNPQIIYKGLPIALVSYVAFPYVLIFLKCLPWIWAGYEVYHRLPSGSVSGIWEMVRRFK